MSSTTSTSVQSTRYNDCLPTVVQSSEPSSIQSVAQNALRPTMSAELFIESNRRFYAVWAKKNEATLSLVEKALAAAQNLPNSDQKSKVLEDLAECKKNIENGIPVIAVEGNGELKSEVSKTLTELLGKLEGIKGKIEAAIEKKEISNAKTTHEECQSEFSNIGKAFEKALEERKKIVDRHKEHLLYPTFSAQTKKELVLKTGYSQELWEAVDKEFALHSEELKQERSKSLGARNAIYTIQSLIQTQLAQLKEVYNPTPPLYQRVYSFWSGSQETKQEGLVEKPAPV